MEANKEDARTCLKKAREAFNSGDAEKARKLANKSKRLFAMKETEDFLQELATGATGGPQTRSHTSMPDPGTNQSESENHSTSSRSHTREQQEAVEKILKCKDYYEILSVSKDVSESGLKKQYKKLALQFHPDKNSAPKADEAFKKISKAYHILSDTEKRERYDRFGEEGINPQNHAHTFYRTNFEFDLFQEMFGDDPFSNRGGVFYEFGPGGTMYYMRRPHHHHHHHHSNHYHQPFFQRSPSLFLLFLCVPLLVTIFSLYFSPPIPYSIYQTRAYPIKRHTSKHDLPYYVQRSFNEDYSENDKISIENMVINDHVEQLKNKCYQGLWDNRRRGKNEIPHSCTRVEDITGRKMRY